MIGAVIIFIAGWTIRKLWPTGALFVLLFAAFSTGFGLLTRRQNLEYLGETISYDAATVAIGYGTTLIIHAVIFLTAFGLSKLFSKKRKYLDKREAEASDD